MADTPAPEGGSKGGSFGFLGRKIGPVPIWLIALGLVGGYYWYTHYGPGATPATPAAPAAPSVIEVQGPAGARGATGARGERGQRGQRGPANREDARVVVPDVVGEKEKTAANKLRRAGLTAERATPYVGTVRSEYPHAGTRVAKHSVVTLRGKPWPAKRGRAEAVPAPVMASAPMTASDIYGSAPTATPAGSTYDSGDVASAMGAAVAVAG